MKYNLKKKKLWIVLILTVLFFVVLYRTKNSQREIGSENFSLSRAMDSLLTSVTPTPFPFQELTIPYLRNRNYQSALGTMDQAYETTNYIGYLTSYNSDGLKINGLLTIPKGETPSGGWPAIVFLHGYIPPTQYQTLERYTDYVDYIARNGFVVFKVDLRGNGQSEGMPGGAYYSSDYIIDTLNAYAALASSNLINPQKIGLWGHSMAGNVVLRSFAVKPDIPAVVIWAGAGYTYLDLRQYRISDASYRPPQLITQRSRDRQRLNDLYGSPSAESTFWQQVAPTNYLTDLKGAIQLNHAADDDVVSVEYSRNLNQLLNETAVIHEFNEYESGGHNITGASFTQAMQKTVEFFKKYLGE
ncbi:alpha/beta fold hydrolase [Candidatus Microgenomates bacterium]|nr:alpha/beta fold hydrolase [Candidatus Microgenomates bacterium]